MKRIIKLLITLLIVSFTLCGCRDLLDNSTALVVMVGNHENSTKFTVKLDDILPKTYEEKGQAYFICIDVNPSTEFDEGEPLGKISDEIYDKYPNKDFLRKNLKSIIEPLFTSGESLIPNDPEVNTLAALFEAKSIFDNDSRKNKEIILYDTGLCTSGDLNFCTSDYFNREVSDIVDELALGFCIPDLEGVNITWYGLGEVAYPQSELTNIQKNHLKEIWAGIINKSGAKVSFKTIPHNKDEITPKYDMHVSVVELDNNVRKEIYFKGDSSEFSDSIKAHETIDEIISAMNKDMQSKWCIIGCTASIGNNQNYNYQKLSQNRVATIRNSLISQGISEERLLFCSLGFNNPWHINNLNTNNTQIEKIAASNRKVVVLSTDSEEFKKHADIFEANYFTIK